MGTSAVLSSSSCFASRSDLLHRPQVQVRRVAAGKSGGGSVEEGSEPCAELLMRRRTAVASGLSLASSVALGFPGQGLAVKQGLLAGRIPGLSEPDKNGWMTYHRPDDKSGGHGVGWSPIIPYIFKVPRGWEEVPVSIADLGGTEIDLRFASSKEGRLFVIVAPVLRFAVMVRGRGSSMVDRRGGRQGTSPSEPDLTPTQSGSTQPPEAVVAQSGPTHTPQAAAALSGSPHTPGSALGSTASRHLDSTDDSQLDVIYVDDVEDPKRFKPDKVTRNISECVIRHMPGPIVKWKQYPLEVRNALFHDFTRTVRFRGPRDEALARRVWEATSAERFKQWLYNARQKAKSNSGTDDPLQWKNHCPEFIREEIWHALCDRWGAENWQRISSVASANRGKYPEASVHTGGSVSFGTHKEKLKQVFQREPTWAEVFDRTHKKERGTGSYVSEKSKTVMEAYTHDVMEKYGEDVSQHLSLDPAVWMTAVGESKKGRLYGFGSSLDAKKVISSQQSEPSLSSTCSTAMASGQESWRHVMREEISQQMSVMKDEVNQSISHLFTHYFGQMGMFPPQPTVSPSCPQEHGADEDDDRDDTIS